MNLYYYILNYKLYKKNSSIVREECALPIHQKSTYNFRNPSTPITYTPKTCLQNSNNDSIHICILIPKRFLPYFRITDAPIVLHMSVSKYVSRLVSMFYRSVSILVSCLIYELICLIVYYCVCCGKFF